MTGFIYEYRVADSVSTASEVAKVQKKVQANQISNDTLTVDLKRSFKLDGFDFNRKDDIAVGAAIAKFQEGADTHQKILMNESQGLLQEAATLVGTGFLKNPNNSNDIVLSIGPQMTYNHFSKKKDGTIILEGSNVLYGYKNYSKETFLYKRVGQPVQELSISDNKALFDSIVQRLDRFNREFTENGKLIPLSVEYERQDGVIETIEIEPVVLLELTVNLEKGNPKPDSQVRITSNDADAKILINNPKFNQKAKIYFDQVKQLDQMVGEATKIQDSVQKWSDRLGPFLGKLIGRQDKLDQSIVGIEKLLTEDFVSQINDKEKLVRLYELPLSSEKKSALEYADFLLRALPYPSLKAPEYQSVHKQVKIEVSSEVKSGPEPDARERRKSTP